MSKDITIKQNGVAQNISVDKLRTAKEEGGSDDWVPEEDIGVKTLRVWRNGTYNAGSFDVFGFDVVEVAVDEHGGAGAEVVGDAHTGELTAHNPAIQEGELARVMGGAKRIVVDKQGGGTLALVAEGDLETGSLSASSNRVYRARNDGKYAYTSVTVDVESGGGGGGGGDEPYDPDNLPNALIVNPLNITYGDGDTIILQSGDAKAYVATPNPYGGTDYVIWTHPNYPNGIIPVSEVSISPTTATYEEDPVDHGRRIIDTPLDVGGASINIGTGTVKIYFTDQNGVDRTDAISWGYPDSVVFTLAAKKESESMIRFHLIHASATYSSTSGLDSSYTHDGKTVYYKDTNAYTSHPYATGIQVGTVNGTNAPLSPYDADHIAQIAWSMVYGTVAPAGVSFQKIDATWDRPHDGQALTTDFTIFVYPQGQNPLEGGEVVGEGGTQT